jgi:E3 ubiquitin-protein ligase listerin
MSITLSVTCFAPEPPRLDRYRNELAASALGVRPSQINSEGLIILRKLAMTAPDPDSEVVFLPQVRAVNLVKACQQWVGSDEDVDELVESEMTFLFFHLAPILQDVSGSHWDFIFDVVENNIEVRLGKKLTNTCSNTHAELFIERHFNPCYLGSESEAGDCSGAVSNSK